MYNPFNLINKNILVTGASSGIGRAIAIECSRMGASVLLVGRNKERLNETLSFMDEKEKHVIACADFAKEEEVAELIESFPFSELNGIVHAAGFTIAKPFQFLKQEDFTSIMNVNFMTPVSLTQQLLKKKKIIKSASIVFISSISGVYCSAPGLSAYSATKGAVNGVVKGLALDLANRGIRVNCVNPGMIDTNIYSEGLITASQLEEDAKKYPLKRYGTPQEVAYAVVYLLSDASRWVTGSNLLIDGGFTLL